MRAETCVDAVVARGDGGRCAVVEYTLWYRRVRRGSPLPIPTSKLSAARTVLYSTVCRLSFTVCLDMPAMSKNEGVNKMVLYTNLVVQYIGYCM